MNQKQMEYFLEVYRQGNIQNAANQLYVSRQGVSKIIKTLEDELGNCFLSAILTALPPQTMPLHFFPMSSAC